MPAKGFQIIGIEAKRHRKAGHQKQVRIDHNTNIISVRKNNDNELIIETRYTVSYGLLGIVQLDCEVTYHEEKSDFSLDTFLSQNSAIIIYLTYPIIYHIIWAR